MTGAGSGYIDNGCVLNPLPEFPLYIFMALSLYRNAVRSPLYRDYPAGK